MPCTVLDPFAGTGTALAVAIQHGRHAIGIELNPEYAAMCRETCEQAATATEADAKGLSVKELTQGQLSLLEG